MASKWCLCGERVDWLDDFCEACRAQIKLERLEEFERLEAVDWDGEPFYSLGFDEYFATPDAAHRFAIDHGVSVRELMPAPVEPTVFTSLDVVDRWGRESPAGFGPPDALRRLVDEFNERLSSIPTGRYAPVEGKRLVLLVVGEALVDEL